jgi:DNA-binding YbaB/EbfC family protein
MSEDREAGTPNFSQLLESAQKVQQEINRVQSQLARKIVEGSAGGGMVVAVANGRQQLLSIRIEKEIVDANELEMLQDLVVAAVNQALAAAAALAQKELSQVAGGIGLKLPGVG